MVETFSTCIIKHLIYLIFNIFCVSGDISIALMCDTSVAMSSSQAMAKKHNWKGEIVISSQEDRFSPSRDSLDSGFSSGFSSFPASPSTNVALDDLPPRLTKCDDLPPPLINFSLYEEDEDDEPAAKMPRLVAIGEENEEDEEMFECENNNSILPQLDMIEKELDEVKSEVDIQQESTISAKKRVRISTPDETTNDENTDPYAKCLKPQHPCRWSSCAEEFFDVNDLYDHFMEQHLQSLRPSSSSSSSSNNSNSTTTQRRRTVCDDKEEQASEKKYRCQWSECETSLKRGTPDKKVRFCSFCNKMSIGLSIYLNKRKSWKRD